MKFQLLDIGKALRLSQKILLRSLIFIVFGISLIALLASFTDVGQVLALLAQFPAKINFSIFGFLAAYFILKFQLFRFLIAQLSLIVSYRRVMIVFVLGELAREFPVGPGLFLLLLAKPKGLRIFPFKLFAVPIIQITYEILIALFILIVVGIGQYNFVKILAAEGIIAIVFLIYLIKKFGILKFILKFAAKSGLVPKSTKAAIEIKLGLEELITAKAILPAILICASYMLSLAFVLFLIGQAVFDTLLPQAMSTFAIAYIFAIISPLPIDLGVTESAGFLILTNLGAGREAALATMLIYRIILSVSSWVLVGVIVAILLSELKVLFGHFVEEES